MMKNIPYRFLLHPVAYQEVKLLDDSLKGQAFCLMQKIENDGQLIRQGHKLIGGNLYQLRIKSDNKAATLCYYQNATDFILLYAMEGQQKSTTSEAIRQARDRLEKLKKPVTLDEIKNSMLNTDESLNAYSEAGQELVMLEALHAMRERAGLSKTELAARLNIKLPSLLGLERNPMGASMKTLAKYAAACGASIELKINYK